MEFIGTIAAAETVQEGASKITGRPWRKQGFVIENKAVSETEALHFVVFNDSIERLQSQGMQVGASGRVSIDASVRQYNGRYFNDFRGWKWEPAQSWQQAAAQEQPAAQPQRIEAVDYLKQQPAGSTPRVAPARPGTPPTVNANDDLPF